MLIDFIATDARAQSAKKILERTHTVRSGILFSEADTPPDLLVLPIPPTRDGHTLTGTSYTLADCRKALAKARKKPLVLGYGACPAKLDLAPYRDLSRDEAFVLVNAELTAEGGMMLLESFLAERGLSLYRQAAVVLGYGRIARAISSRLSANGVSVLVGARRSEARGAAREAGYHPFDCTDSSFFFERGRLLFAERPHLLVNTVPDSSVITPLAQMPNPLCALELSGKSDVLAACASLPYPTLDGKAIPTRFFPKTAGALLAEAIERSLY